MTMLAKQQESLLHIIAVIIGNRQWQFFFV